MYRRTNTVMDKNAAFFPQSMLNGLGFDDWGYDESDYNYGEVYTDPAAAWDYAADTAASYPTDYAYIPPAPAQAAKDSGFGAAFADVLKTLPAAVRDIYLANNAAEAQAKMMDLNIARARQGLPPLNMPSYVQQYRPGAMPMQPSGPGFFRDATGRIDTAKVAAGVGVGLGAWFLLRKSRR